MNKKSVRQSNVSQRLRHICLHSSVPVSSHHPTRKIGWFFFPPNQHSPALHYNRSVAIILSRCICLSMYVRPKSVISHLTPFAPVPAIYPFEFPTPLMSKARSAILIGYRILIKLSPMAIFYLAEPSRCLLNSVCRIFMRYNFGDIKLSWRV